MKRREFLKTIKVGAVGAAATMTLPGFLQNSFSNGKRTPNIINIIVDDLGWGDLGCYGNPTIKTPHIDHFASQGTLFTQYYVNGATCMPTRLGIMTGRFPAWNLFEFHPDAPERREDGRPGRYLDPKRPNITNILKANGYVTGHFGKWHIAAGDTHVASPGEYGIDTYRVDHPHKPNVYELFSEEDRDHPKEATDRITIEESIRFIETHKDEKFYLNVWCVLPHAPLNPYDEETEEYEKYMPKLNAIKERGAMAIYYASVTHLDKLIGRLLRTLDTLGLNENTLVILTSDNGPEYIQLGETSHSGVGSSGPFRGRKRSSYEGCLRMPCIVRWPGYVKAGRVDTESVISGADMLPTFCTYAGIDTKKEWKLDGEDISDILQGKSRVRTKPLFWCNPIADLPATGPQIHKSPILAMRDGDWKFLINPDETDPALYHIPSDPAEMQNRMEEMPEIAVRMKTALLAWFETLPHDPRVDAWSHGRFAWNWPLAAEGYKSIEKKLVYKETFDQGKPKGWTVDGGYWTVKDGKYIQTDNGRDGLKVSGPKGESWSDFVLKFRVAEFQGDVLKVAFRDNGQFYYSLELGRNAEWSGLKVFSQKSWDKRIAPVPFALDDQPHEIVIMAAEDEIKVWVDGSQKTFAKNSDIQAGSFKLATWMAKAKFDDVEVYAIKVHR